jgi:hypothetical protein
MGLLVITPALARLYRQVQRHSSDHVCPLPILLQWLKALVPVLEAAIIVVQTETTTTTLAFEDLCLLLEYMKQGQRSTPVLVAEVGVVHLWTLTTMRTAPHPRGTPERIIDTTIPLPNHNVIQTETASVVTETGEGMTENASGRGRRIARAIGNVTGLAVIGTGTVVGVVSGNETGSETAVRSASMNVSVRSNESGIEGVGIKIVEATAGVSVIDNITIESGRKKVVAAVEEGMAGIHAMVDMVLPDAGGDLLAVVEVILKSLVIGRWPNAWDSSPKTEKPKLFFFLVLFSSFAMLYIYPSTTFLFSFYLAISSMVEDLFFTRTHFSVLFFSILLFISHR